MARPMLAVAAAIFATVALVEVGVRLLAASGALDVGTPRGDDALYWKGDHPTFGVWHEANASWVHRSKCFQVKYTTNSVGARDVERSREAEGPRVAVLGDSFFEGWGVLASERMSNRLEAMTGVPHLNFAMAHFGPYQQLIAYRELVSGFEHDAVIASLVPTNDFADTDYDLSRATESYRYLYRPYLIGDPPDLRHVDVRENAARSWLRQHSYAFNSVLPLIDAWSARRFQAARDVAMLGAGDPASRFYDYEDSAARRIEIILARLAEAVGERPLAVVLVPTDTDLVRFRSDAASPLGQRLARAAKRDGYRLVDLLEPMAERSAVFGRFSFACDYHWNSLAHEVAADLVSNALGRDFVPGLPEPVEDSARGVRAEPEA